MKKLLILAAIIIPSFAFAGGPYISSAVVGQYVEGSSPTNNNRVPFWFYVDMGGFIPNATYHYYCSLDSVSPAIASLGAGNPYLINPVSGTIRRILNPSMTANTGFDSLVADATGHIKAWYGVEPTGNVRFMPGRTVCPKILLNDGAGGTVVTWKMDLAAYQVTVLNFGVTSMSVTQGSALYDSLDATPKNFICVYDNVTATGRPVSIAIVENDAMMLRPISSIANFYRMRVDSLDYHWGTIIPNNLPNGVRALQERAFINATPVDTVTDSDGIWCYGTNTVNMTNGNQALYLNSTFVLSDSANIPDTTWTGMPTSFSVTSNSPNSTYSWDFGDLGTGSGANVNHTYLAPGVVNVQVIISTGGCSDTINHTVVVLLSTGVLVPMPLSFQLMPNPASGEFFITTKDRNEKMIVVTNLLGEEVYAETLSGNKISIDIAAQPKGIYLVQVKDTVTGKSGVKKIVLQ
jgi:hypothetical protein